MLPQISHCYWKSILDKCRNGRNRTSVLHLCSLMWKCGLEIHRWLGSYVVTVLVDVGSTHLAENVFDMLLYRNEYCWNSIISGYAKIGEPEYAFSLYRLMLDDVSVLPDVNIFISLLNICGKIKDVERGIVLHLEVAKRGLLEEDPFVANSLIDMYAKCGLIVEAHQIFDKFQYRDTVLWTTMIAGYVEHGHHEEALESFEQMQSMGIVPNSVTYSFILKACCSFGDIEKVEKVYADVEKQGILGESLLVGNSLVHVYIKFGLLVKAQEVFDKLPIRNVASWTILLSGYADYGLGQEGLECFERMQAESFQPDATAFVCSLKACTISGSVDKGQEIHADIERHGLVKNNLLVGSTLVNMYAKCCLLEKAQNVFDSLLARTVVSWNSLIAGYAEHGHAIQAFHCYRTMQLESVIPDSATAISVLMAFCKLQRVDRVCEIHVLIESQGLLRKYLILGNALVGAYVTVGLIEVAYKVLDKLPLRDVITWTTIITGYLDHGHGKQALECFKQMQIEGIPPDVTILTCGIKACSIIGDIKAGQEKHCEIERFGFLEEEPTVGNSLIDMYLKCGSVVKAHEVFHNLHVKNIVSWNTLISGYVEAGQSEKALECYDEMIKEGICPNSVSFICSLNACDTIGDISKVSQIHKDIEKNGLLEKDPAVGGTLIKVYAKHGLLSNAQQVFDSFPFQDIVTWTTLLAGYTNFGHGDEAAKCLEQIQLHVDLPNVITYICSLKACSAIGAIEKGQEIHLEIENQGLLTNEVIGNTLVAMYAKCGYMVKAREVFDKLHVRNVISWTALMNGYVRIGDGERVWHIFDMMLGEGIRPDPVTFIVLLTGCNRTGLYNKSESYFEAMGKDYGIVPASTHYNCMIDSLARDGKLEEAQLMVKEMPNLPDLVGWNTILGACKKWGNVNLARWAFEQSRWAFYSPSEDIS